MDRREFGRLLGIALPVASLGLGGLRRVSQQLSPEQALVDFERGFRRQFASWREVLPATVDYVDLEGHNTTRASFPLASYHTCHCPSRPMDHVSRQEYEPTDLVVKVRESLLEIAVPDNTAEPIVAWWVGPEGRLSIMHNLPATRSPEGLGDWTAIQLRKKIVKRLASLKEPRVAVLGEPQCFTGRDATLHERYFAMSACWWAEDLEVA